MSIEIKIYPSENLQSDEHLLFHAIAYGSLSYDVFFDLTELYEYSFKQHLTVLLLQNIYLFLREYQKLLHILSMTLTM